MTELEEKIEYIFNAMATAKANINNMPSGSFSSRERALALTKLDEAQMWFQKSLIPVNQSNE